MHTYESIANAHDVKDKTARRWVSKAEKVAGHPLGHQPAHDQPKQFSDSELELILAQKPNRPVVTESVKAVIVETGSASLDKYGKMAESFTNGAVPASAQDRTVQIQQWTNKAAEATASQHHFSELLSDEEIQNAIQKGAERGALKAALERQAELKTYEAAMGGQSPKHPSPDGSREP